MRRAIAVLAVGALLYGCAAPWPQVIARADPMFAQRARPIVKVDVLPVDLQLWVDEPSRGAPEALRLDAENAIVGAVTTGLYQRGYDVSALIDWQGGYTGAGGARAVAMDRDALLATIDSLSSYGTAASRTGGMPVPYLPAHLGDATGADATLYIGGWSYVGSDPPSAGRIVTYVLIAVVIVAVVVIVIAAAKSGSGGGGLGGAVEGAGRALVSAGRVAATVTARVATGVARVVAENAPRLIDAAVRTADAFGHVETHIEICGERPDWHAQEELPREGNSSMYLEMTLVDNRTGMALWHARQRFPASGAHKEDVERVVASMLAELPPAP